MPSRRACLAALAATAGCVDPFGSASPSNDRAADAPTDSPTDVPPTSPGGDATVRYSFVGTGDLYAGERALVVSRSWREWLRTAAAGDTVRAKATPEDCGRSPLRELSAVRLRDAGTHTGAYRVGGDTGGYYEYTYRTERATPPDDATVHPFDGLPSGVRGTVGRIIDEGAESLPPQGRAAQYLRSEHEDDELWVRRDGATYRLYARVPTITPPCDYYLVLRLSPVDDADRSLSLASLDEPGRIAADARAETPRSLARYTAHDRARLRAFDHCMTLAGFYEVEVVDRRHRRESRSHRRPHDG